jgi:hypothetical protein
MLIVTENPKLMRPGMRRSFQRHGYLYAARRHAGWTGGWHRSRRVRRTHRSTNNGAHGAP